MKRITRKQALGCRLDCALEPVLSVAAEELFTIETEDASRGLLRAADRPPTPETTPYVTKVPGQGNPVAGPVAVTGVRAGSVAAVRIEDIQLNAGGAFWSRELASPFGDSASWADLGGPFTVGIRHEAGRGVLNSRLSWPLRPMIGTLALAPEWEVRSTSTGQGPWGGNLDCTDFVPGATVFLNAYHDGGLLFVGDVHGSQGDGEFAGAADESRAEVTLAVAPVDRPWLPNPRIVTADSLIALHIARPLEAAARGATEHLMSWLIEEHGFSQREALVSVSVNPGFRYRVYQMTAMESLQFVVGASLPRAFVEGV